MELLSERRVSHAAHGSMTGWKNLLRPRWWRNLRTAEETLLLNRLACFRTEADSFEITEPHRYTQSCVEHFT